MSGALAAMLSAGVNRVGVIQDVANGIHAVGVTLNLGTDGTYTMTGAAGGGGNWIKPATATVAAYYEVKVDVTSGAFASGTTGTWLAMTSSRGWIEDSGEVIFDISWRVALTGEVIKVQAGVSMEKI